MANSAENRINLGVLQQNDPYITDILVTAHQVALYLFSSSKKEWEKTEIEGTMFAYSRAASPEHGFMILNRLGRNNLVEPIIAGIEFQPQNPFLLYRNRIGAIHGIWFYDRSECDHVTQLMIKLANSATDKASASANRNRTVSEDAARIAAPTLPPQPQLSNGHINAAPPPPSNSNPLDIMQMLTRARQVHDSKQTAMEPKSMTDSPAVTTGGTSPLVRPLALRPAVDIVRPLMATSAPVLPPPVAMVTSVSASPHGKATVSSGPRTAEPKPISLDVLFRSASTSKPATAAVGEAEVVPMVKRLLSLNEGSTAVPVRREASPKQVQSPNRRSFGRQISESNAVDYTQHTGASIRVWDERDDSSEIKVGQPLCLATLLPGVAVSSGSASQQQQQPNAILKRGSTDTGVYGAGNTTEDNINVKTSTYTPEKNQPQSAGGGEPALVLMTPAHLLSSSSSASRRRQESASSISPQPPQPDKILLPPADFFFAPKLPVIPSPAAAAAAAAVPVMLAPVQMPPPPIVPPQASSVILDRTQLQTALIDLLKSDDEFLTTIHNAYLRRCWAESNLNK